MLVRLLLLIGVIVISFTAGMYATTPEGEKAYKDILAKVFPEEQAPEAEASSVPATEEDIAQQRANLALATAGGGFGPQSPRDLDTAVGNNARSYASAPPYSEMNLCNIHFHEGAEHRGGNFTTYAGPGDGKGYGTGFCSTAR